MNNYFIELLHELGFIWLIPISTLIVSIGWMIDWFLKKNEKEAILNRLLDFEEKIGEISIKDWQLKIARIVISFWKFLGNNIIFFSASNSDAIKQKVNIKVLIIWFVKTFLFGILAYSLVLIFGVALNRIWEVKEVDILILSMCLFAIVFPPLYAVLGFKKQDFLNRGINLLLLSYFVTISLLIIGYNLVDFNTGEIWIQKLANLREPNIDVNFTTFLTLYGAPNYLCDLLGITFSILLLKKFLRSEKHIIFYALLDVIFSLILYCGLYIFYSYLIYDKNPNVSIEIIDSFRSILALFKGDESSYRITEIPLLLSSFIPILLYSFCFIFFGLILSPLFKFTRRFLTVLSEKEKSPFFELGLVVSQILLIGMSLLAFIKVLLK